MFTRLCTLVMIPFHFRAKIITKPVASSSDYRRYCRRYCRKYFRRHFIICWPCVHVYTHFPPFQVTTMTTSIPRSWFTSRRYPSILKRYFSHTCPLNNVRRNPLGIQMISEKLRHQIFGPLDVKNQDDHEKQLSKVKDHLSKHGLWRRSEEMTPNQPELEIDIPKLEGNIEDHFMKLGQRYTEQIMTLCDSLCKSQMPPIPKKWSSKPGWTMYDKEGKMIEITCPSDPLLVFDVEVCVTSNNLPVIATAVSPSAWYSWCHPSMTDDTIVRDNAFHSLDDLISVGRFDSESRIIIGHNISYDRSFLKEQYDINCDQTRFLDTMSFHLCISGLTGYQRALSTSYNSSLKKGINEAILHDLFRLKGQPNPVLWRDYGSLNNLKDVHEFYCKSYKGFKSISKEDRNIFVEGSLDDIRKDFQNLVTYCAHDVKATRDVFLRQWPLFLERCPHPVTLAGMLEMSIMYLPVNGKNWNKYIESSDKSFDELNQQIIASLATLACQACSLSHQEKYKKDIWLWDLDWSTQCIRFKKSQELNDMKKLVSYQQTLPCKTNISLPLQTILWSKKFLKKVQPNLPGYPSWFRDVCSKSSDNPNWKPGYPFKISTQMRAVPKLMRLMWDGYAIHHDKKHGWGFLVPDSDPKPYEPDDPEAPRFPYEEYIKIVKPRGRNQDPYDDSSDILVFDNDGEQVTEVLDANLSKGTDWTTSRPEFCPEVKVYGCRFYKLPHKDGVEANVGNPLSRDFLRYVEEGRLTAFDNDIAHNLLKLNKGISYWKMNSKRIKGQMIVSLDSQNENCAIIPRVVVAGTVTRRAVEPTWLTASNAYPDRVGSELKAMVEAPQGWKFVGADVDSQELWIASVLGDAHFAGMHGSTGIGWMTLEGRRIDATDFHSKTASIADISRNDAKVLNYGRIYGAGKIFAGRFLKQSNPSLTDDEAKRKARDIYQQTKGIRRSGKWFGGTESFMFNCLEEIALRDCPTTPVLGCRVSRALESIHVKDDFMMSIVNWVVQSSAVDFLHLMLVSMKWLFDCYDIKGRFAISIHDEVRFIVSEEDQYKAALALQLTNLLTRCFVSSRLSLPDLPRSIAFFTSVDIDQVLRKEPSLECQTPSNKEGMSKGYGILPGQSLDIEQILEILKSQQIGLQNSKDRDNAIMYTP